MARIFAVTVLLLTFPSFATAQKSLSAPDTGQTFLALDLFGLCVWYPTAEGMPQEPYCGWDLGASVRFVRWLGITGTIGGQRIRGLQTYQVVAGPRFTTPYFAPDTPLMFRGFAHVLVGYAHSGGWSVSDVQAPGSVEWIVGVGFDWTYLRFQADYVNLTMAGLPKVSGRGLIGLSIPLCLRGCRDTDGIDLSGRK